MLVYLCKGSLTNWIWMFELHVQISLDNKFQLKVTILIFWTKFVQKECFRSKTEKMNRAIAFCIVELAELPNFSLNWQFWFFWPNLPKREFQVKNRKIALVRASMVVTYYTKPFCTGADKQRYFNVSSPSSRRDKKLRFPQFCNF